jgi:hypothetical protein
MSIESTKYEQTVKEKMEYKLSEEDRKTFNLLSDAFWVEFYEYVVRSKD